MATKKFETNGSVLDASTVPEKPVPAPMTKEQLAEKKRLDKIEATITRSKQPLQRKRKSLGRS